MSERLSSFFVVPAYGFFDWGIQMRSLEPKESHNDEYVKFFDLLNHEKRDSRSVEITLKIGRKEFPATISLSKQRNKKWTHRDTIRFSWPSKFNTMKALRKMFIYSYVTTIKKEKPNLKELAEFVHLGGSNFRVKAIGKQVTEFDDMFQFMEDKNLFEFWREEEKQKKTMKIFLNNAINPVWRKVDKFDKYKKRTHVIYLLHHSEKNQLYVGKANVFGTRVKKGKAHQGIDEGWDQFMFFELDPEFVSLYDIEHLEDFAIRLFTTILENNFRIKSLKDKPKLVNKALKKK